MNELSPAGLAAALGLHPPTPEQAAIIAADPRRPCIVVAGAGSGKTETMAARVVWLVANGHVTPEEILGLTFTRKAAGELAERVGRRLRALHGRGLLCERPEDAGTPMIATYHSYASGLVRDHGLRIGIEPETALLGEAAAWQLAGELVERWRPELDPEYLGDVTTGLTADDVRAIDRTSSTLVESLLSLAGQCAEHLVTPNDLADQLDRLADELTRRPKVLGGPPDEPTASSNTGRALASIRARRSLIPMLRSYLAVKQQREVMDFGDQVVFATRLARLPEVAASQRSQFRIVLLDEFQDTSHAQLELLATLFGEDRAVMAVGDPNQSIYGWRGASAGNLDTFHSRFGTRGRHRVLSLTTSWRNPRLVLTAANKVAAPLRTQPGVEVRALLPAPSATDGSVTAAWHQTSLAEAAWVAEQVQRSWRPGVDTAAVVCRRRSQFVGIERALKERGLPVEVVGLGGLLHRPEVADVVAVLQVLADPTRSDALLRLLTGPRWDLGPRDLMAFGDWARVLGRDGDAVARGVAPPRGVAPARDEVELARHGVQLAGSQSIGTQFSGPEPAPRPHRTEPDSEGLDQVSLIDALEQLPPPDWAGRAGYGLSAAGRQRLVRLAGELRRLRQRVALPLVDLVAEVQRSLLLDIELGLLDVGRNQLDEFLDVAADFSAGPGTDSLIGFVAWLGVAAERERGLARAEDEDPEPVRDGTAETVDPSTTLVQVLTVHAAKGLEWDVVVVPGMVEGRFPSMRVTRDGVDRASAWPTTIGDVPYPLRGDRGSLPHWNLDSPATIKELEASLAEFRGQAGAHLVREERRLAYVAVTRSRRDLVLSGFTWDAETSGARMPSRFLREIVALTDVGIPLDASSADLPDQLPDGSNPLLAEPARHPWPVVTGPGDALLAAADLVRAAGSRDPGSADGLIGSERDLSAAPDAPDLTGLAVEIDRLLAERVADRAPASAVHLPAHLSASQAVSLAADPQGFALSWRRPLPSEPRPSTRRGTAFHEWIEGRLHSQALIGLHDLPGAADDDVVPDGQLEALKLAFESSGWARREVLATEIDIETPVGGVVFRGRIDAVFAAAPAAAPVRFELVDWKTSYPPTGPARDAAQVQLAVYRVALSRLWQVPLEQVRASFFYPGAGRTVTPPGLDESVLTRLLDAIPVESQEVGPEQEMWK